MLKISTVAVALFSLTGAATVFASAPSDPSAQATGLFDGVVPARKSPALPNSAKKFLAPVDAFDGTVAGVAARFIPIPAGSFVMGSPQDDPGHEDDETQHRVRLSKGFEIQATEVTQLQYFLVMGVNPSHWVAKDICDPGNHRILGSTNLCQHHPVEYLTWAEAAKFIQRLNKMQRKYSYRLPTEAEWEYVARAGSKTQWPFAGSAQVVADYNEHAWHYENSDWHTHLVWSKKPNPWGVYGMYGNVAEFVMDAYEPFAAQDLVDPKGPAKGDERVVRGASCYTDPDKIRLGDRDRFSIPQRAYNTGLRLVRVRR